MDARALDRERLDGVLRRVLEPWFPRCLDHEYGGYLCDFDHRWRPRGSQVKMLEFQARQTRVAALGVRRDPSDAAMRAACEQGWAALRDSLWDGEHGGWYACADRAWTPAHGGEKHSHGTAYAILACLDVGRTLDEPEALARAQEGFEWLDAHAWDREHGGYWGWMRRDGRPHATDPDAAPRGRDHLGHGPTAKSVNVAGDMVETLGELQAHRPSPLAEERLADLVGHFDGWLATTGGLPTTFHGDLSPIDGPPHGGYAVQASWRLPVARAALGESLAVGEVDRGFRDWGTGVRGPRGFVMDGGGREEWWMQYELVRSLLLEGAVHPERAPSCRARAAAGLARIERAFLDTARGGVRQLPRRPFRHTPKGTAWKDGSHEAMAYEMSARLAARPVDGPPLALAEALST
jgi:mannobiose 2-epimerase